MRVIITKTNRLGEEIINNQNLRMKIVEYRSTNDIDVQFDDGYLIKHTSYSRFKNKTLKNRNVLNWKYKIGDRIKDEKRDLTITNIKIKNKNKQKNENFYSQREKWYQYHCNICGWDDGWTSEQYIFYDKQGCSCCAGKTAVKGINTFGDKYPEVLPLLKDPEEAFKYTCGSHHELCFKCKICGTYKYQTIVNYIRQGLGCNKCGNGISYPEKFMMSVLNQLNIKYTYQLTKKDFEWCEKYKYDFYLIDYNMIIETHGGQHSFKSFETCGGKTLEEEQENDRLKKELAINNNISKYVVIEADFSNVDCLIKGIINSEFSKLFADKIDSIDFIKCDIDAQRNLLKEACELWESMKPEVSTPIIANKLNIARYTAWDYLRKGSKLGLCSYNPDEERRKSQLKCTQIAKEKRMKPVAVYTIEDKYIGNFKSSSGLIEYFQNTFNMKLNKSNISQCCLEKYKQYKGYKFRYIEKLED